MKPIWVEEFISSIAFSKVLQGYSASSASRQAFILLDNAFEQFMNECVADNKDQKQNKNYNQLLDEFSMKIDMADKEKQRFLEFHKIRNSMYHRNNYFVVGNERYDEFLNLIMKNTRYKDISLENEIINAFEKIVSEHSEKCYADKFSLKLSRKETARFVLQDTIIDNFSIQGNAYIGEFILGEMPGVNITNYEEIKFLIQGTIKSSDKCVYVLELIDSNCENPFHSFIISNKIGGNWKCFVDSFWSKTGDGDCRYIQKIRELIAAHGNRIIYKIDFFKRGLLNDMFLDLID